MCDLDLGNEVYDHHFIVSTFANSDRFILAFKKSKFGHVLVDIPATNTCSWGDLDHW